MPRIVQGLLWVLATTVARVRTGGAAAHRLPSARAVRLPRAPRPRAAIRAAVDGGVEERDVVVIGSGLGGLSCASLLATAGYDVLVCESHYELGGCAHEFCYRPDGTPVQSEKVAPGERVFRFESGPSLYSGFSWQDGSPNPLKHVYQMIGEEPEWITFDTWGAFLPEAPEGYSLSIGAEAFEKILETYGGPHALEDWGRLVERLRPLTYGAKAIPAVAVRPDAGALITVVSRYPGAVLRTLFDAGKLTQPFSLVLEEVRVHAALRRKRARAGTCLGAMAPVAYAHAAHTACARAHTRRGPAGGCPACLLCACFPCAAGRRVHARRPRSPIHS